MFAFIPLFIASVAFWSLYQQQFTVVTIYSDQRLDRFIGGFEMPVPWVQSINPVFIIVLSGVFAAIWTRLGHRQPATPLKFAAGTMTMGLALLLFLPFVGAAPTRPTAGADRHRAGVHPRRTAAFPVGLSVTTKLAPEAFHAQMVALFYLSVSLGTAISGELARFYTAENEGTYFGALGGIAIGIGALLAVASPWMLKLMRGVR